MLLLLLLLLMMMMMTTKIVMSVMFQVECRLLASRDEFIKQLDS